MNLLLIFLESKMLQGLASLLNPRVVLDACAEFCRHRINDRLNWIFILNNEKSYFSMHFKIDSFVWWVRLCFALKMREPNMTIILDQGTPGNLWTYWRYRATKSKKSEVGSNYTGMGTAG